MCLLALPLHAQDAIEIPTHHRNWQVSVAFFAGASVLDATSSRGMYELNPVLGRGQFGARQAATKGLIEAGLIAGEWIVLRRHPGAQRTFTVVNYAAGSATAAVAVRNWRVR